jgi:hypothetical protein
MIAVADRVHAVLVLAEKSKATGINAKGWEKILSAVKVEGPSAQAKSKPESIPGGISAYTLSSGGRLLVKPVHHTPLVAATMSFKSGQLLEPASKAGAMNLLARTLLRARRTRARRSWRRPWTT